MLRGLPNVILTPHIGGSTEEAQADIGAFVGGKLADFLAVGSTSLSVNLPQVALPPLAGTHRLAHVHRNVPGRDGRDQHGAGRARRQRRGAAARHSRRLGYALTDIAIDYPELSWTSCARATRRSGCASCLDPGGRAADPLSGRSTSSLDSDLRASYETDWTGRFTGTSRAVVRPATTAEVAQVLAACAEARVPVVVQGGNTGLVGGGVPARDGR